MRPGLLLALLAMRSQYLRAHRLSGRLLESHWASDARSALLRGHRTTMAAAATKEATAPSEEASVKPSHFIRNIILDDLKTGKHADIVTRFPPEPNGYLHLGHAKSICVNFGLGIEFSGRTYMRFDDTNPEKEEQEYIDAIKADVEWLGFDWGPRLTHASDYFGQFHEYAVQLVREGKAYVESLSPEEMREYRGTLTTKGTNSPYRERSVEENLRLFEAMTNGELEDGAAVLRLKIDMASPNMNMRDPAIYRIKRNATHPMTGDQWKVYPMYDYAHALTDALEGITHSLCTPSSRRTGRCMIGSSRTCRCRARRGRSSSRASACSIRCSRSGS